MSQASAASPSSALARSGWSGSTAMSMVSWRRPSMIASASFSSSPASRMIQPARWWTMSRIMSSLASSVRPAQVTIPSRIGMWRSSVIARLERLAEQRRDFERAASGAATALFTIPPSRSWSSDSSRSAISREPPSRIRPSGRRVGEEAADRAGDVDVAHPPRDHRGDQEIVAQEGGEGLADPVLVARDDRGVRDRDAERMAEQGGDREPVGEAADHRRLGERLDEAERRIGFVEAVGGEEDRRHRDQHAGRDRPACRRTPPGRGDSRGRAGSRLMPPQYAATARSVHSAGCGAGRGPCVLGPAVGEHPAEPAARATSRSCRRG